MLVKLAIRGVATWAQLLLVTRRLAELARMDDERVG